MNAFLTLLLVSLCGMSYGLRIPVVSRSVDVSSRSMPKPDCNNTNNNSMRGRPGVYMQGMHVSSHSQFHENVENAKDVVYATNITLGGKQFPIQLDTGSSDVWVQPPFALDLLNTTDIQANLTFGIGAVSGNISFAEMSLGPYKVPSQAFVNATVATDFGAIFSNNIFGIMGLAFDQASTVFVETLVNFGRNNTSGRTFLSNIFAQNASAPNLFTVLLGRSDDPDGDQEGVFTISEYDADLGNVAEEPKLFRTPAQLTNLTTLPRWSVQMDKMTVNGKDFQFNTSSVPEAEPGKQVVVLDTGFTFSQIPPPAVDFIYQSIPGTVFNNATGLYEVPCNATTELVFEFGGKQIPIHPLDLTVVKNNGNQTVCNNAFRSLNLPPGAAAGFDQILGVSFLKNVYVSFDFGDWTPNNNTNNLPFVQMKSVTNFQEALGEFNTTRPKQVASVTAAAANTTTAANVTTGALDQGFIPLNSDIVHKLPREGGLVFRREDAPVEKRERVIIKVTGHGMAVPAGQGMLMRIMQHPVSKHMMNCVHRMVQSYGAVIVALLGTLIFFSAITMFVGIVIAIRLYERSKSPSEEGYEVVYGKEEGVQLFYEEDETREV